MRGVQSGCARRAFAAALGWALVASAPVAEAIPAFARKYQTSCQTCHTIFPKLNAFGEAFRLNGYRMPKETEEMVKEKPVSLGAPAYKRLWPHAVWPGEVASTVPLAINVKFADVNTSTLNPDGTTTRIKNDFQFPQEANIFGGGTLGEHVSYLAELTFSENPDWSAAVEIEHARLDFDSPFGPENAFHFRLGKFAPNLADVFQEMWITTDAAIDALFGYNPVTGAGFTAGSDPQPQTISLPVRVRGIEMYGVIQHRLLYAVGVANGIFPGNDGQFNGNNSKDFYGRVDYKFGGMGLDGDTGDKETPAQNWRDDSFRVGAFFYRGNGAGVNLASTTDAGLDVNVQDAHFLRTGFFASVYFKDLNVFGGFLRGSDTLRQLDPASGDFLQETTPDYHAWFAQADYVFYPWLHGAMRYETVTPGDRRLQSPRTGTANVSALIRANVKAMLEYQRDLRQSENHSLNAIVRFAF